MRSSTPLTLTVLAAALAATLAGCSGGGTPHPTASSAVAPPSPSSSADGSSASSAPGSSGTTAAGTSSPSASSSCGPATGSAAAAAAIAALPLPSGLSGFHWDAANADYSGYDPCAPLSWSVVTLAGSTASSPYAILLFHDGTYLGTATKEQYGFQPAVHRTSPSAISVTYVFPKTGDSDADPTGRATATYTWNESAGKVVMAGSTPPAQ